MLIESQEFWQKFNIPTYIKNKLLYFLFNKMVYYFFLQSKQQRNTYFLVEYFQIPGPQVVASNHLRCLGILVFICCKIFRAAHNYLGMCHRFQGYCKRHLSIPQASLNPLILSRASLIPSVEILFQIFHICKNVLPVQNKI